MKKLFCLLAVMICMLCIPIQSSADCVTLPGDLTVLEDEAFYQDAKITEAVIPDGTESIGARAFADSGLQIIYIPDSVNSIDSSAFEGLGEHFAIFAPKDSVAYRHAQEHLYTWCNWPTYNDFMLWMLQQCDANGDGRFNEEEITQVTAIDCSEKGFTSLDGVEVFHELRNLNCFQNKLSILDISRNTKLTYLSCAGNQLTALDVSNNPELVSLGCGESIMNGTMYGIPYGNQITHLDISNNPLLEVLWCPHNNLTELDVSHNPELKYLGCFDNQITYLDTGTNPKLQRLLTGGNPLGTIDVSQNTELYQLNCYDNGLTSLDIRQNSKLTFLWCNDNELSILDLGNQPLLQSINCSGNKLTSMDLSHNTALKTLNCDDNLLTAIGLENCLSLQEFICNANSLQSLDVSSNRELRSLQLWNNHLTGIDLSQNTELISVNLSANNNLADLVLGDMQKLEALRVQNTSLTALDLRTSPILLETYRNGTRFEFYGNGNIAEAGEGSFYGYQYNVGPNPGGMSEVSRCSLCFNKTVAIITDDADLKDSYTITSDIGSSFVVESVVETGKDIAVRCTVLPEYSADDSTMFVLRYGKDGNCIYSEGISIASLKSGYTCAFSKDEVSQHEIPPIITLYTDMKESYDISADIGDSFVVDAILDTGDYIDVLCSVALDFADENQDMSFALGYGIDGNLIYRHGISMAALKEGCVCSFSKETINQHNIPSAITLYTDLKASYTIESVIGDAFTVNSIIDTGSNMIVRCSVAPDYSPGSGIVYSIWYGVEGNGIHRDGISLETLQQGMSCSFSKEIINQYNVPSVIGLHEG